MARTKRSTSLANTACSLTENRRKSISPCPSLENLGSIKKTRKTTRRRQPSKRLKKASKKSPVRYLTYKSGSNGKRHRIRLFLENEILSFRHKVKKIELETPEEDFDCQSDEELVNTTVLQKYRELKRAANRLFDLQL